MKTKACELDCEFESEVLAAMLESRWSDGFDANLREHVSKCASCSEVVAVASAIECDRDDLRAHATVPDSGRVWWLVQVRARREAVKTAASPITVAQVIAVGCAAGALGACFGATSTWFQYALHSLRVSLNRVDLHAVLAGHAVLAIGMAALLLVVPAAVYFAIAKD